MLCLRGCIESFHHLVFVFCKWGPGGQVHAPGARGSGSLTVQPSATSPPSLPRRADSQLGPWAPWQDLPKVLGGSGFAHVPCRVSGQLSPTGAARTTARGAPQGPAHPHPWAVSIPLGEACPPRAEAVGLCAGGQPVLLPTSGLGTARSRGGGCLGRSAPANIKQAIAPHQERLLGGARQEGIPGPSMALVLDQARMGTVPGHASPAAVQRDAGAARTPRPAGRGPQARATWTQGWGHEVEA